MGFQCQALLFLLFEIPLVGLPIWMTFRKHCSFGLLFLFPICQTTRYNRLLLWPSSVWGRTQMCFLKFQCKRTMTGISHNLPGVQRIPGNHFPQVEVFENLLVIGPSVINEPKLGDMMLFFLLCPLTQAGWTAALNKTTKLQSHEYLFLQKPK